MVFIIIAFKKKGVKCRHVHVFIYLQFKIKKIKNGMTEQT